MKLSLTRLLLINKRLFQTWSFLVLLALIPLTAFGLSRVSTAEKGILTIDETGNSFVEYGQLAAGKDVALVGHFCGLEMHMTRVDSISILEKRPQSGQTSSRESKKSKDTELSRYPSIDLIVRGLLVRHLFQCPPFQAGFYKRLTFNHFSV